MSALLELARRCEAASADDVVQLAELENDIRRALKFNDEGRPLVASLDAAMTLAPDGWGSKAQQLGYPTFWTLVEPGVGREVIGVGADFALALCAAALRARAAQAMEAREGGNEVPSRSDDSAVAAISGDASNLGLPEEGVEALVETVARAICGVNEPDPDEEMLPGTPCWVALIPEAQAVIAALKASLPTPVIEEGLVEKVAIAMFETGINIGASTWPDEQMIAAEELARAAIEAMGSPNVS